MASNDVKLKPQDRETCLLFKSWLTFCLQVSKKLIAPGISELVACSGYKLQRTWAYWCKDKNEHHPYWMDKREVVINSMPNIYINFYGWNYDFAILPNKTTSTICARVK